MKISGINFRSPSVLIGTLLAVIGIGVILFGSAGLTKLNAVPEDAPPEPVDLIAQPPEPEPVIYTATIAAVGDLLIHTPINNSVKNHSTGEYDYTEVFTPIEPYLSFSDFAIANLETRMAGPGRGYSGYPLFNTPESFADAIVWSGFDLVAMANNHSMDMGVNGIYTTLENLNNVNIPAIGNYSTAEDREEIYFCDVNGINIAILNYTERTNGIPVPSSSYYACNVLDIDTISQEAVRARNQGADIVIALLHFGEEYQRNNNSNQENIVTTIFEGGVDCVIGSHPHVVQPVETISIMRGDETVDCYVAYSLGNFVSNQRDRYTDSGIILYLDIVKDDSGTRINDLYYLPVYVQKVQANSKWNYRILPVHPDIKVESDIEISDSDQRRMDQVWDELYSHLVDDSGTIHPLDVTGIESVDEHNFHL